MNGERRIITSGECLASPHYAVVCHGPSLPAVLAAGYHAVHQHGPPPSVLIETQREDSLRQTVNSLEKATAHVDKGNRTRLQ